MKNQKKRKQYKQLYYQTDGYMKCRLKRENSLEYKSYKKKYQQTDEM